MTPLSLGVHFGIPADRYHADPAPRPSLSNTIGKKLLRQSPLHAWTAHPGLNPDWEPEDSSTFDIGRAAHRAVLGRGEDWAVYPPGILGANGAVSTKAAKEWAESVRAEGLTPIKDEVEQKVLAMNYRADIALDENGIVLDPDRSEVVVIAEVDGVMCRIMVDNAPEDPALPLYDFKTCGDASPDAIMRSIFTYGYDFQAQFYREAWKAATGETRAFRFIFQEKDAPHEVTVAELGDESLMVAARSTARAREVWHHCIASDYWPGYPRGVQRMELPAWHIERQMDALAMAEDHKAATGHDILDAARRWQAPVAAE